MGLTLVESALEPARNAFGVSETFHTSGVIDRTNPFFLPLGTNARTCETCHLASQGWTITAKGSAKLFEETGGTAPLFMVHDAGTRPDADISTLEARRAVFASVTEKGLIRFGRTVPATSEFAVTSVVDPTGFGTPAAFTAFRRPTPTANEAKVSAMNWNGGPTADIPAQLALTFNGATRFHGQRPDNVPPETAALVPPMQIGIFFAQTADNDAGPLDADGALGGPVNLAAQPFHLGINDIQGLDPDGTPFDRKVFNIFDAWEIYDRHHGKRGHDCRKDDHGRNVSHRKAAARASIFRGQELFNNHEFDMTGVHGINDLFGQETVRGTCSTCHNVPNVGGHSVFRMFGLGTADPPNCSPELPLVTLQHNVTGETRVVCDMGRGGNGTWADVGAFRAPPLRGLAARAPYFHDGQRRSIMAVINYYDRRFNMGLSHREKEDLEAFLGAL